MSAAGIAIAIGLIILFIAWQQRHHLSFGGRTGIVTAQLRPQQRHLERKLVKLLGGNRQTAERLIRQSILRYPDRSLDWHWEKAIYDLERDRWR